MYVCSDGWINLMGELGVIKWAISWLGSFDLLLSEEIRSELHFFFLPTELGYASFDGSDVAVAAGLGIILSLWHKENLCYLRTSSKKNKTSLLALNNNTCHTWQWIHMNPSIFQLCTLLFFFFMWHSFIFPPQCLWMIKWYWFFQAAALPAKVWSENLLTLSYCC